jgi:hypothetical protein
MRWDNPTDRVVVGPELLREIEEQMVKIKQNLKASQDRHKSCVDKGRTHREFKMGDHMLLKVNAKRSSVKLGKFSKLETCYCGSLEILEKIGPFSYMLPLPSLMCIHNVFHVYFLKKYVLEVNHFIDWNVIQVELEGDFRV